MTLSLDIFLTIREFALLQTAVEGRAEPFPGARDAIATKLEAARLVPRSQIPVDVVRLGCRVAFKVGEQMMERIVVAGPTGEDWNSTLLLTSPRGVALIGARTGSVVYACLDDGTNEELTIESVSFETPGAKLSLVASSDRPRTKRSSVNATALPDGDDPGPSAA